MLGDIGYDEQLRLENARLKEEVYIALLFPLISISFLCCFLVALLYYKKTVYGFESNVYMFFVCLIGSLREFVVLLQDTALGGVLKQ